jgi:hypothetical protein
MTELKKHFPVSSKWVGIKELQLKQDEVFLQTAAFAREFWKRLVKNLGERRAKQLMNSIMGVKQSGPREQREEAYMTGLIILYIRYLGMDESDAKIAKCIFESKPYFVECESGYFGIVNAIFTEEIMCRDQTILKRTPINKTLPTIKKQVERIRRSLIEDKIFPQEYAPRPYNRD